MTSSLSRHRHYPSSEGQPGSVVWFISFGDLLTLLLCFFLVLTPWHLLNNTSNNQSLQRVSSQNSAFMPGGTTFASDLLLRGSVVKLELPIFAGALDGNGVEDSKLEDIERELSGALPEGRSVEVLVCAPREDRARLVHEVAEMFKRSARDEMPRRFTISRNCENDRVLVPVTERIVGRIRILGM